MDALIQFSPGTASDAAHRADVLFFTLLGLTAFVALCIFAVAAFFIVRYRAGAVVDRRAPPVSNPWLEAAWIGIPLAIFLGFGVWGAYVYGVL
jgi:cytochrome c oxidase subunit 2